MFATDSYMLIDEGKYDFIGLIWDEQRCSLFESIEEFLFGKVIMSLVTRFLENLSSASQIKLNASVFFSAPIADFISQISSHAQMHDDAMSISLINIVSVSCESSTVKRQHIEKIPMNLYNAIVARSSKN